MTTEGIHRETAQSIASPSTVKHTETQYITRTEIQSKGSMTVGKPKGAGCAAAASCRRAGATRRTQENDRNSLNTPPNAETSTLADS